MSNMHNEQTNEKIYEEIFDEVLEQDSKGLLETEIRDMQLIYNLHPDDDRDAILEFIAESIYYNQDTMEVAWK